MGICLQRVPSGFQRSHAYNLPGRLGFEHHLLAREGIGALARLGGGFLDHHELREAGDEEHAAPFQFPVAQVGQRLHDAPHVALGKFGADSNFFD